jgi:hypothetical protein
MNQTKELRQLKKRKRVEDTLVLTLIEHLAILSERIDKLERDIAGSRLRGYPGGD